MRLLAWITSICMFSTAVVTQAEVVDVIIVAGQSNAVGAAHPDYVLEQSRPYCAPNEDIRYCFWVHEQVYTDGWTHLRPIGGYSFGVEMMMGYTFKEAAPNRNLAMMKYAYNGVSLACEWNPNGCTQNGTLQLFEGLKQWMNTYRIMIENEGDTCNFAGLAWIQGESDMMAEWQAVMYKDLMTQFIDDIRVHANNPDMPVVMALVNPTASGFNWVDLIHEGMHEIAANDSKVATATCRDLPLRSDNIHFAADSAIWLGGRLADSLMAMDLFNTTSAPPPVPTCPGDFNGDGTVGATDILLVINNWGICP